MWLSNLRFLMLTCVAVALAGCGFTPVYGTDGPGQALLGTILVDAPSTRPEQLLVQQIEARLGRANAERFTLGYKLKVEEERMAVTEANTTARFNLIGKADFELRDVSTGTVLTKGSVSQFVGYSATGTTAATLTAQTDAYQRLSTILADQIVARLMAASPDLGL